MARRSFAVIGLGRFGQAMAVTLSELGHDVIGIDADGDRVAQLADQVTQAVQLDATDEKALKAAGIQDVDVAIISIGEDIESSVLAAMLVKDLGVRNIVAKAITPLHGRILKRLGVSRVVYPERDMAIRVANSLVMPNVLDYIELSRDFSIVEIPAPPGFVGRTLKELALRPKRGIQIIAIKRRAASGDVTTVAPSADEPIGEGDVLSILGPNDRLADLADVIGAPGGRGRG